MHDWRRAHQRAFTAEGEFDALSIQDVPVERRRPTVGLDGSEPRGEPELGAAVPAILDERQVLGVGHQPRRDARRLEVHSMSR